MSFHSDDDLRPTGTISGWSEITTNHREDDPIRYGEHDFTLPDLLALLRTMKSYLNPDKLNNLEKMITDHISNYNNPHKTTLDKLGTSVLQELYKLWLSEGNNGTQNQFLKVIFQYVRIADLQTTLAGVARDEVPSIYGMAEYVKRHDKDPDAHEELFKRIIPGEPIYTEPSFAAYGFCGMPEFADISRAGSMYYIDQTGNLSVAPADTLPCDFTFDVGAFPIFGSCTGQIANNASINTISGVTYTNMTAQHVETSATEFDLSVNSKYARLKESTDTSAKEHSLVYTKSGTNYASGKYYTVSMFIRDLRTDVTSGIIGIYLPGVFTAPYSFLHFDLNERKTYKNSTINNNQLIGGVSKLRNGWYRVWATFYVTANTAMSFKLTALDILDGDNVYTGSGRNICDVLYPQITEGSQVTPPLISNNTTAPVLEPTYIKLDFSKIYLGRFNPLNGTIIVSVVPPMGESLAQAKYIYDLANSSSVSFINGRYPASHKQRMYATWNSASGSSIGYKYINNALDKTFVTYVHGYATNKQVLASNAHPAETVTHTTGLGTTASELYIGCDRYKTATSVVNSYISKIIYYPFICTELQTGFLIGD